MRCSCGVMRKRRNIIINVLELKAAMLEVFMWSDEGKTEHINVLELKAAMLGVLSLCRNLHDYHIRIELGYTTALSYINNIGGNHSFKCNKLSG